MAKDKSAILGASVVVATVLGVALVAARAKPPAPPLGGVAFAGFRTELVQAPHQTTYRKRDGAAAWDFRHYPKISLTCDVDGDYTVVWSWRNYVDGSAEPGGTGLNITQVFSGLEGGKTYELELYDVRPENGRDGSIAYGDPEGFFDGVYHLFRSEVEVTVHSPSDAQTSCSGVLQDEFMSIAPLAVNFVGFRVDLIQQAGLGAPRAAPELAAFDFLY